MKHYIFIVEENNITQMNSLSIGYDTVVYAILRIPYTCFTFPYSGKSNNVEPSEASK